MMIERSTPIIPSPPRAFNRKNLTRFGERNRYFFFFFFENNERSLDSFTKVGCEEISLLDPYFFLKSRALFIDDKETEFSWMLFKKRRQKMNLKRSRLSSIE